MTGEWFKVIGVIRATPDNAGFCTPVFQRDVSRTYFLQDFAMPNGRVGEKIKGFLPFENVYSDMIHRVAPNGIFKIGSRVQYGLITPNGETFVGDTASLKDFVSSRFDDLTQDCFLAYRLAYVLGRDDFLVSALRSHAFLGGLMRGEVSLTRSHTLSKAGFTDERVEILKEMWELGLSAKMISKVLGVSRNAVIGKIHRLGLGGEEVFRNPAGSITISVDGQGTVSAVADEEPVRRKGWWSLG